MTSGPSEPDSNRDAIPSVAALVVHLLAHLANQVYAQASRLALLQGAINGRRRRLERIKFMSIIFQQNQEQTRLQLEAEQDFVKFPVMVAVFKDVGAQLLDRQVSHLKPASGDTVLFEETDRLFSDAVQFRKLVMETPFKYIAGFGIHWHANPMAHRNQPQLKKPRHQESRCIPPTPRSPSSQRPGTA